MPVRDLIEKLKSPALEDGFRSEVINTRGATMRGLESGGDQERDIAARYRSDAELAADRWPRTAALLQRISDSYTRDARREDEDAERWRKGLEGPGSGPLQPAAQSADARTSSAESVLYFAYGSNMETSRLEKRTGKAIQRGIGKLANHDVRFDKTSDDKSGKANVVQATGATVWGVLFELTPTQFQKLVKVEKGCDD